jgi:hypothetical protein
MLRNAAVINLFDGCALSVPCHAPGTAPVGLMIAGMQNTDRKISGDRSRGGRNHRKAAWLNLMVGPVGP